MIVYLSPNGDVFQRWDLPAGEVVTLVGYNSALVAQAQTYSPGINQVSFGSASLAANGEVWVSLIGSFGSYQVFAILNPDTLAPRMVQGISKGTQYSSFGFTYPEYAGLAPVDGLNWTTYTLNPGPSTVSSVRLDATSVAVGDNPVKPASLVGNPTSVWSDGSDGTYTETWMTNRSDALYGTSSTGALEVLSTTSSAQSITFGVRFTTSNLGTATGGRVAAWLERPNGTFICALDASAELSGRSSTVSTPLTVVRTLDANDYSGTSMGSVVYWLTQGAVMRIGRYSPSGGEAPPGDYGIQVYEAWLEVQVSTPPPAWSFAALDDDGNFVEGRGDSLTVPTYPTGYYGSYSGPAQISYDGASLWRNATFADGFERYNLQTDVWEATDLSRAGHALNMFAGYDTVNDLAVYVRNRAWAGEDRGFVEVREPGVGAWSPPPVEAADTVGPATATYNPAPSGSRSLWYSTELNWGGYPVRVQGGYLYYTGPIDAHGSSAGVPFGESVGLYRMNLANGATEIVYEFPYEYYDIQGARLTTSVGTDGWYWDNAFMDCRGLIVVDGPPTSIASGPATARPYFFR